MNASIDSQLEAINQLTSEELLGRLISKALAETVMQDDSRGHSLPVPILSDGLYILPKDISSSWHLLSVLMFPTLTVLWNDMVFYGCTRSAMDRHPLALEY